MVETVDIVQLSAIALQISRQIFDCNAGIYTHLLRLLCAKTTFHRLTLLSTGTIYLSQLRDVTKALPGKLPVQIKFRLFPIDCDVRDVLF